MNVAVRDNPMMQLVQNRLLTWFWVNSGHWTVAVDKPPSVTDENSADRIVTMAIKPKSSGCNNLARIVIDAICRRNWKNCAVNACLVPWIVLSLRLPMRCSVEK